MDIIVVTMFDTKNNLTFYIGVVEDNKNSVKNIRNICKSYLKHSVKHCEAVMRHNKIDYENYSGYKERHIHALSEIMDFKCVDDFHDLDLGGEVDMWLEYQGMWT